MKFWRNTLAIVALCTISSMKSNQIMLKASIIKGFAELIDNESIQMIEYAQKIVADSINTLVSDLFPNQGTEMKVATTVKIVGKFLDKYPKVRQERGIDIVYTAIISNGFIVERMPLDRESIYAAIKTMVKIGWSSSRANRRLMQML